MLYLDIGLHHWETEWPLLGGLFIRESLILQCRGSRDGPGGHNLAPLVAGTANTQQGRQLNRLWRVINALLDKYRYM